MRYRIKELFGFHSGSGALTERAIYENQPTSPESAVAVYSGATDDQNNLPVCSKRLVSQSSAPLVSGNGILVARKGRAGSMRIIDGTFTFNDNAYAMTLKRGATDVVDPLYFTIAYQDTFFDLATSKDGNGTFAKGPAEHLSIWLPSIEMQREIASAWRKQERIQARLQAMLERVQRLMKKPAKTEHEKVFPVKDLFRVTSGVRVTQREVYENRGDLPIVTAKTENNGIAWHASREWLSGFKKNGALIVVEAPCLTWCKNGNAGRLFLRNESFFPGDDCGVLVEPTCIDRAWFSFAAQDAVFAGVSSKGGQGKLFEAQMSNIPIHVPVFPQTGEIDLAEQRRIAVQYKRLQNLESKIKKLIDGSRSAMARIRQMAMALTEEKGMAETIPGTILFLDVKDSTAMYEKSGDRIAFAVMDKVSRLLQGVVLAHDGRVIKTIGDGVMCEFATPEAAVPAAIGMQAAIKPYKLNGDPVAIRIGIHHGSVIASNGDVFGDAVNVAARLEGICAVGKISISKEVYDLLPMKMQNQWTLRGPVSLKGKDQMITVFDF